MNVPMLLEVILFGKRQKKSVYFINLIISVYGFYDECKRRTSLKIWRVFVDCFNTLPIAALVAGKIFCVHGGLSLGGSFRYHG